MLRRSAFAVLALALVACATSSGAHRDDGPMRVRLTSWPETTKVSIDCGEGRITDTTPADFTFPDGPDARCSTEFTADHYQPMHLEIDRQYLFKNGEFVKGSQPVAGAPRVMPVYGHVTGFDAIVLSIALGLEHLINAAHRAAVQSQPDVVVHVSLQPQS